MMRFITITFLATMLAASADEPRLSSQLEPLRPFLGKTWKGRFMNSKPEKPMYDVARWERALNGKGVRIVHSVNDGAYGGESMIIWNPKSERLEFRYYTTAGFFTEGSMRVEDKKLVSNEKVIGGSEGVTEVKATMELLPNGKLMAKSEFLKNGNWEPGHEILYEESPGAEVKFR